MNDDAESIRPNYNEPDFDPAQIAPYTLEGPLTFLSGKKVTTPEQWEIRGKDTGKYVTPSTNNYTLDKNLKMEKFSTQDANGFGMAISAMAVVFSGLLLLYIIFRTIGKISTWWALRTAAKAKGLSEEEVKESFAKGSTPGEVFAAIAMAMHEMQEDVHDFEDTILTIHQVERRYSPWNSKIYSLRDIPKK